MKKLLFPLVILLLLFFANGCALSDITQNANDVLAKSEEILTEVDNQVETGKLTQDVADKIKDIVNSTINTVSDKIQDNSGYIFNNVNSTLDNTFYNLTNLLLTLKTEILGGSAVDIMEATMNQIRFTTSSVSSELQDVIVLISGQTLVILDSLTNSIILIVSIVLLAIGVVIFAILFFKKKDKFTFGSLVSLILCGIYVVFFLAVILVTPVRANIIAGLNLGQKVTAKTVEPKIVGIYPSKFVAGNDDRIYIYGNHLNLIKKLGIKLQQGGVVKKEFPASAVIVQNHGQIILGNLDNMSTGFLPYIPYQQFKAEVIDKDVILKQSTQIETIINTKQVQNFEMIKTSIIKPIADVSPILVNPLRTSSLPSLKVTQPIYSVLPSTTVDTSILQSTTAIKLFGAANAFFGKFWDLTEGLYGLFVYDDTKYVEESAPIEIKYPVPPLPTPDIYPSALSFAGDPLIGTNITPKLMLGVLNKQTITSDFTVTLRSTSPSGYSQNVVVKVADLSSVSSSGLLAVYFPNYKISQAGTHSFEVFVDSNNKIVETNESNNKANASVTAKTYKYDITIALQQFVAKKDYDSSDDEYRVDASIFLNSGGEAHVDIDHDGNAGQSWPVNFSKTYNNVRPGDAITVSTSGYEEDAGNWTDPNDDMGSDTDYYPIVDTGTSNTKSQPFVLETDGYKILGTYTTTRTEVTAP